MFASLTIMAMVSLTGAPGMAGGNGRTAWNVSAATATAATIVPIHAIKAVVEKLQIAGVQMAARAHR